LKNASSPTTGTFLKKTTFEYRCRDGHWQRQSRETYDRGNGAVLLLFNVERSTVVLIRQFRFRAFVNGCGDGLLIEACAGLLDGDDVAEGEDTEVIELPLASALQMISTGAIQDGKTIVLLQYAALLGLDRLREA
jgi:hypothetical protein